MLVVTLAAVLPLPAASVEVVTTALLWGVCGALSWAYHRGVTHLDPNRRLRSLSFDAGLLSLLAVLSPPADNLADSLLSAHMVQHMVLLIVAPLLLLFGRPGHPLALGLPRWATRAWLRARHRVGRRLQRLPTLPTVAVLFALFLWIWHLPVLYDAALDNETLHALEHVCFLASGLLLWAMIMDDRRGLVPRLMLVFATAFHSGLLSAALTFAPVPLYAPYTRQTEFLLSPLTDQQLGGIVMWASMGVTFLATIAVLMKRMLDQPDPEPELVVHA